jgi:U4/U6 small nuclear ribonucleoprotein PRP31
LALSLIPSCNIALLGQPSRQAIRSSTTSSSSSQTQLEYKHSHAGYLSHSVVIQSIHPQYRAKMTKHLAGKVALCARIDSFQTYNDGREGRRMRSEFEEHVGKISGAVSNPGNSQVNAFKVKKALPVPEEKKKAHRGGRRVRKLKEKWAMSEVRKKANQLHMDNNNNNNENMMMGREYSESAMGMDNDLVGNVGSRTGGMSGGSRVRGVTAKSSLFLKRHNNNNDNKSSNSSNSSGATNGMSSSLVFTPVQGLELVDPSAAAKRVKEANMKWFEAHSGFLSAPPKPL